MGRDSYWHKALHLYLGLLEDWAFVSVPSLCEWCRPLAEYIILSRRKLELLSEFHDDISEI